MTNKHNTKRALLASVLSMVMCLTMLIGSTLAWFTDTATTGVNTITSGNLDMKVSYKNKGVATWTEVSPSEKLFDDATLWEPGHTEVAYLKIENLGSLAFKYQLTVNVLNEIAGKNKDGGEIKLSEVLKYDLIPLEEETTYVDRNAALEAIEGEGNFLTTETVSGNIEAKATENYYALVVYMPDSTDNKANHNGTDIPSIQLGVNIVATQDTVESDSFNNQYDKGVPYPMILTAFQSSGEVVKTYAAGNKVRDVTVNALGGNGKDKITVYKSNYDVTEDVTYTTSCDINLVDSTETSMTYDIDLSITDDNGVEVPLTSAATVILYVPDGIEVTGVSRGGEAFTTSSGTPKADAKYKFLASTKKLQLGCLTFGTFEVTFKSTSVATVDGVGYSELRSAVEAAKPGDTIVMLEDASASELRVSDKVVTVDLNGKALALKNLTMSAPAFKVQGGSVTYKNGDLTVSSYMDISENGTLNLENANITFTSAATNGIQLWSGALNLDENSSITAVSDTDAILVLNDASDTNTKINIRGSINTVGGYAITGNGQTTAPNSTEINIYETASIVSTETTAIYHPQNGTLNIYGGTVSGKLCAVEIRGGNMNISGGKLTSTADSFSAEANGSGLTTEGAAIAVSQHATELPINVTVSDGEFSGVYAIYENDFQNTRPSENVVITINGGTFNGEILSVNNKVTFN